MMSTHENFTRMRLKLMPNPSFDQHLDASYARDHNEPIPGEYTQFEENGM